MESKAASKRLGRIRRKKRIRRKVSGHSERPRLSVYRSLRHMSAQIIDDEAGKTLVYATTLSEEFRGGAGKGKGKTGEGAALGKMLARKAVEKGIKSVTFDRSGYAYHGRVKALAEAAREEGLEF
jgi:large subunit ribosomal protein L18